MRDELWDQITETLHRVMWRGDFKGFQSGVMWSDLHVLCTWLGLWGGKWIRERVTGYNETSVVLQEKMEAVKGLYSGHLRILRFLLPTFQEALISWDPWGYEENESTCGAMGTSTWSGLKCSHWMWVDGPWWWAQTKSLITYRAGDWFGGERIT